VGRRLFIAWILLSGFAGTAPAQIVNGSFESAPDHLTGWTLGPGARVEALQAGNFAPGGVTVPDGNWLVLVANGPGDVPTAPSGDFDANGVTDNDSATLSTTFTTTLPGESLSFQWAFLTDEVGAGGQGDPNFDDLFDITIDGNSILNGSVRKPGGSSPFPDTVAYDSVRYTVTSGGLTNGADFGTSAGGGATPFQNMVLAIAAPGTYTLQFLVADQGDSVFDSALIIDDVQVGGGVDPTIQITNSTETLTEFKNGVFLFTAVDNRQAASSGDGSRLTFRSNGDYQGDNPGLSEQIWLVDRSGSSFAISRVSAAVSGSFGEPDISTDSRWLVFASDADLLPGTNIDGNREIFRYEIAGGLLAQITDTAGCDNAQPTINNDGTRITFLSDCDLGFGTTGNEIVLWDGAFDGVDTVGCTNRDPRISRDAAGRYVTFITDCSGPPYGPANPDGGLEILQWDTQTGLYSAVTSTPAGLFNDVARSNGDGRYVSFVSDADHEAGENPAGDWVVFLHDQLSGTSTQLTDPDPLGISIAAAIDPAAQFVAVEKFNLATFGQDVTLVETATPRVELPVAAGTASIFNSLPTVSAAPGGAQIVFLSNGDFSGNNADLNVELWAASPGFNAPTEMTYCSTPNLAIPDRNNQGVTDTINVTDPGNLVGLKVLVRIEHTWVGDLRVDLRNLNTTENRRLIARPGRPPGAGCSGDDIDATLDDDAASPAENECVTPGPVAIEGSFTPRQSLDQFYGSPLAADWRLQVSDRRGSNIGTLVEWCLIATTE